MRDTILRATPFDFWFTMAVTGMVTLAACYGVFRFVRRARLIEDIPTSKIRSAAQGYVELNGTADLLDGTPIVAPLSQLQCVWYDYRIEEQRTSTVGGSRKRKWHTVERGTSDGLFRIADGTGEVVVDPDGAEVTPAVHQTWYGGERYPGSAPFVERGASGGSVVARLGIGMSIGFGRFRYTEWRIMPVTRVYVIGQYRTLGGTDSGDRREEVGSLLREWKRDQAEMLARFDADGDGDIDLQEWDAARRAAEQQVDAALRERQAAAPVNVIARTGIGRRPFIISVRAQQELARSYRWYAGLSLCAFLSFGTATFWSIGLRLGGG